MNYNDKIKYIPDWILEKNLSNEERYAVSCSYSYWVEKETEKAILVYWATDYGRVSCWVPKSVLSDENIKKAKKYEKKQEEIAQTFFDGMDRHKKLVNFAKENGVKVRDNYKTATILDKLNKANIETPEYLKSTKLFKQYKLA